MKLNRKYTPGEWGVYHYENGLLEGVAFIANNDGQSVCSMVGMTYEEANGLLIAAAPDMVEALIAMLEDYRTEGCPDPDCKVCQASDAAKAKAFASLRKAGVLE